MWNGICVECGSSEVYVKGTAVWSTSGGFLALVRTRLFKNSVALETALCVQCGLVVFRVPPAQRKELPEIVQEKGWTQLRGSHHV